MKSNTPLVLGKMRNGKSKVWKCAVCDELTDSNLARTSEPMSLTHSSTCADVLKSISTAVETIDWRFVTLSRLQYANGLEPIGQNDPRWQERPFAYEIYHKLRCYWEKQHWDTPYAIQAEVLKTYQEIRQVNKMPDLLIHQPNTKNNLAVVEIKMASNTEKLLRDDLDKLVLFHCALKYELRVEIIIGDNDKLKELLARLNEWDTPRDTCATQIHVIMLSLDDKKIETRCIHYLSEKYSNITP